MTAQHTASAPLLSVRNLGKHFDMHHLERRLAAFSGVSFDLKAGQFMLLRGENGVGKSTLLRVLYRSYVAKDGQAIYQSGLGPIDLARAADVDISWLREHEIGFVTQFLIARPRVAADEIVAEPLRLAGTSHADSLREARDWLDSFGLKSDLWAAYPSTFSGGEQQKVNLARALIRPRKLLFLDEPTASLDLAARAALVERLTRLKGQGVAMIGIFHHPEDVAHLVDSEFALSSSATGGRLHVVQ
ncbi:MAG TPA: ATP-binding cassette domain-containing protein [Devosia sp.]|nr:ATP-binding cassette domain-containing protein [Devosia sp.]